MYLRRGRKCRYQCSWVFYVLLVFSFYVCCVQSSNYNSNLLKENISERKKRNDDKEGYMIEELLSNEHKRQGDENNDLPDVKKRLPEKNILQNEETIVEKLLSKIEHYRSGDSEKKKRLSKKNLDDSQHEKYQETLIEKLLPDYQTIFGSSQTNEPYDKWVTTLKKRLLKKKRSENKDNTQFTNGDEVFTELRNKLFKRNLLEKVRHKANLFENSLKNDDVNDSVMKTQNFDENLKETVDNEMKKRLSKKSSHADEEFDYEDEFQKCLREKNTNNDNFEDDETAVKNRSKKSIQNYEDFDDEHLEFKKGISKKYSNNGNFDDDETEVKKRSKKNIQNDEEFNNEDLEFKKRLKKKNKNNDNFDYDETEVKKRSKKNIQNDDEFDNEDLGFKKRSRKKNSNNDNFDDDETEVKKRSKKNIQNDDEFYNEDLGFKKRSRKKNSNNNNFDDDETEVKKRSKKNIQHDDEFDNEDLGFKKRSRKKNSNNDNFDDDDTEVKKRSKKNIQNDEEFDNEDPEHKKRLLKKDVPIGDKEEDPDDEFISETPEFEKNLSKKRYKIYEKDSEIEAQDVRKRIGKRDIYQNEEGYNKELDLKKRLSKKNTNPTEDNNGEEQEFKKRFSKKNFFGSEPKQECFEDEESALENILNKEVSYPRENPYVRAFQSSPLSGELPLLKLPPNALIHDVALDSNDTYHLYWQVDYQSESVRMEVHSRATSPHPWMSIGFSDRGGLPGGDVCVFWIGWKKKAHFQNAFIDSEKRLVVSPTQECRNFRYRFNQGVLKLTFTRRFDTCKQNHYIIERGTTHIIWSWGEGPLYDLDGVLAEGDVNGMVRVELLKPLLTEPSLEGTEEIDITSNSAIVPAEETTYWCTVHKLPERFEEKHHIFKFGPKIQKRNEDIVHHMEVFHCEHPSDFKVPLYEGPCHADDRPAEIDACKRVLAAWAMGALPFSYPEEAGLPFGGEDFNPFVMLEVHYNNPSLIAGRIDSSGMSLTYSRQLRRYDAAIMELGLEYTAKMAVPPRMKSFLLEGYCIPECTAVGLAPEGIFIFGSQLHTHLTGIRAWTKHFRGGNELPELNRDNHYSTHFQEIRRLPYLVHVLPGDSLVTTCQDRTVDRANVTVGGFAISDEMCVDYVHYYPKSDLEVCKSSIDSKTLMDYFESMNRLEFQETSPDFDWRGNYEAIDWNPLRGNFLQELYNEAPLSMQCNKSTGERFPGYWENKPLPTVSHHLPIPERECSLKEHFRMNEEIIIV